MKRTDYISWDEYFMGVALLSAQRSKDNSSQVGACIVSPENKILSMGYNGMPRGCFDDDMPWEREGEPLKTKYMYVCHAELNAILNHAASAGSLKGARIYTTLFPCNECAKALIQSGIAGSDLLRGQVRGHRFRRRLEADVRSRGNPLHALPPHRPQRDGGTVTKNPLFRVRFGVADRGFFHFFENQEIMY